MTRRTSAPESTVERLARRAEEDRQENAEHFSTMREILEDIRTEIRRGAQNTGLLAQKVDNLEFQLNLTRDEVQRRAVTPAPSQIASAKTAIADAAKSPWARLIAFCVGLLTVFSLLNNLPDMARGAERIWLFVTGREIKAVEVIIPPAGAPPPEK